MIDSIRRFLNRPLAEDFSLRYQAFSSVQGGLYVFLFLYFFVQGNFRPESSRVQALALLAAGVLAATFFANAVVPRVIPRWYDEDQWTVGKHCLQTVFVLFCISLSNNLVLTLTNNEAPSFGNMFLTVSVIGFFPITLTVLLAEQRRLKRHLKQAELVNQVLPAATLAQPEPTILPNAVTSVPSLEQIATVKLPASITFIPTVGKDRLTLQPDQLRVIESVGNYVDVYWVNGDAIQKTTLRLTLKDVEATLASYPQFFRCHRAFVVNLEAVQHTVGNARGFLLTLRDLPQEIPVSRSFADEFEARLLGQGGPH